MELGQGRLVRSFSYSMQRAPGGTWSCREAAAHRGAGIDGSMAEAARSGGRQEDAGEEEWIPHRMHVYN